jgi:hypothetical protein
MLKKEKKTYLWARGTMPAEPIVVSALPWAIAVRGGVVALLTAVVVVASGER